MIPLHRVREAVDLLEEILKIQKEHDDEALKEQLYDFEKGALSNFMEGINDLHETASFIKEEAEDQESEEEAGEDEEEDSEDADEEK